MYGRYCEQRDFLYFFFLSFRNLIRCNHGFIFSGVGRVFPSRVSPFISSFPDFFWREGILYIYTKFGRKLEAISLSCCSVNTTHFIFAGSFSRMCNNCPIFLSDIIRLLLASDFIIELLALSLFFFSLVSVLRVSIYLVEGAEEKSRPQTAPLWKFQFVRSNVCDATPL